jgi:putative membrane protein
MFIKRRLLAAIVTACAISATPSLAHDGQPLAPHDLWAAWKWDPFILGGLLLAGWLYARGVRAVWRRAGVGRGTAIWRVVAFGGGLAALFIALISPLDALSGALFAAHMAQHLLLMLVAAPLLVLGAPPVSLAWAVPPAARRPLIHWWRGRQWLLAGWRALSQPTIVWALHVAALWLWHLPILYEAALRRELVHTLEHTSFFGTALLFWWTVAGRPFHTPDGRNERLSYGLGILYLFTMALQGGLLGFLLTFAGGLWYPAYAGSTAAWGMTPLADQQLAGAIMWIPANVIYMLGALILLGVWLQGLEQRMAAGRTQSAVKQTEG